MVVNFFKPDLYRDGDDGNGGGVEDPGEVVYGDDVD